MIVRASNGRFKSPFLRKHHETLEIIALIAMCVCAAWLGFSLHEIWGGRG